MTGAKLPVENDGTERTEREILIGPSAHVGKLMPKANLAGFEGEEYLEILEMYVKSIGG